MVDGWMTKAGKLGNAGKVLDSHPIFDSYDEKDKKKRAKGIEIKVFLMAFCINRPSRNLYPSTVDVMRKKMRK